MIRSSLARAAAIASASIALLAGGCAENQPTAPLTARAPAASPSLNPLAPAVTIPSETIGYAPLAMRDVPLANDVVVTKTIGRLGGVIAIPEAGFAIVFSPRAVEHPTAITVTAVAGNKIAYKFEPHGIEFDRPVVIQQLLAGTNAATNFSALSGVYLSSGEKDIKPDGDAAVAEFRPTEVLTHLLKGVPVGYAALFGIHHFSGYALATGRSGGNGQ